MTQGQGRRVGELLKAAGLITSDQLLEALREHERTGADRFTILRDEAFQTAARARRRDLRDAVVHAERDALGDERLHRLPRHQTAAARFISQT